MNKKGVEGLPLRYLVIALGAALAVGIVLEMTTSLNQGITGAVTKITEVLSNQVASLP